MNAQCCSGGSGSPIAGGASQGTLLEHQAEFNVNYQNLNSSKFLNGDQPAENFLEHYFSQYIYSRGAYGITSKLTLSIELGYYLNRTQYGFHYNDTARSSGVSDLIIFPRYTIFNRCRAKSMTDITLGMGIKIPLGRYNDSLKYFTNPVSGEELYLRKPPSVQPTTGAQDFIFYGFGIHSLTEKNLKFFTALLYIRKGWNPLGEKSGDFGSIGLFASKTIRNKWTGTLQLRGELNGKMKRNADLPFPNYDPKATGSKKIFISPQISYTFRRALTFYLMEDFPLYQYLNEIQIASGFQTTCGITWRFMITKKTQ